VDGAWRRCKYFFDLMVVYGDAAIIFFDLWMVHGDAAKQF